MPELIKNGHVYITLTPLYKIKYGSKFKYLLNDKELLIKNGHVYITLTPLYKIKYGSKFKYLLNDKELEKFIPTIQGKYNYQISRFKGLTN